MQQQETWSPQIIMGLWADHRELHSKLKTVESDGDSDSRNASRLARRC